LRAIEPIIRDGKTVFAENGKAVPFILDPKWVVAPTGLRGAGDGV
jgi:hypothetical protein